jgi:hypothetical protein
MFGLFARSSNLTAFAGASSLSQISTKNCGKDVEKCPGNNYNFTKSQVFLFIAYFWFSLFINDIGWLY